MCVRACVHACVHVCVMCVYVYVCACVHVCVYVLEERGKKSWRVWPSSFPVLQISGAISKATRS